MMGIRKIVIFLCLLLVSVNWRVVRSQRVGPVITTKHGSLLGREQFSAGGRKVFSFRGIRYAESPGGRMFSYTRPATDSWSGTKSAQEPGLPCPQPFMTGQYSEDCLHLSVYTPSLSSNRYIPVLIFLTGNLFTFDANGDLNPEDLVAERNIIVVTVSSRLNAFGFLSFENVVLPGNTGLLDQFYALIWIKENIQYFGGDSSRITLAGSGSGGASALYLALSPRTSGVAQVMSVSGSPLASWSRSDNAAENARRFVDRVNCNGPNSRVVLSCLESKNIREIIAGVENHLSNGNMSNIFAPVIDTFLDSSRQFVGESINNLERGRVDKRIRFIIGENEADGTEIMFLLRRNLERLNVNDLKYFVENTLIPVSLQKYGNLVFSPFIQQLLSFQYFPSQVSQGENQSKAKTLREVQTFLTDSNYVAPIRSSLEKLLKSGSEVYSFINTHPIFQLKTGIRNERSAGAGSFTALLFGEKQFERQTGTRMQRFDKDASNNVQAALMSLIEFRSSPPGVRWSYYTQQRHYLEINTLRSATQYKVRFTKI